MHMGDWEGKTYQEIERACPEEWHRFWQTPLRFKADNKGETFEELSRRSQISIEKIIADHPGESIGIISHRITIKMIVADLLNISIDDLLDVSPNSVTKIVVEKNKAILERYSDTSHYELLKEPLKS
ncbi:histidine phosphatase family protein, partial [Acinetobacter baumannii]|uniref:histidine phosphatase family protein n=1 Tax=Acinetobacter baumannii TaxID=470 RepID=UPI0034CF32E1